MKKVVAMFLVFVITLSCAVVSFAEETAQSESQFERVLLQKGTAFKKEFVDCKELHDKWENSIIIQTAILTDLETGSKYYALRMIYKREVGVLDLDEIDGAISTLEYIKAHKSEMIDYSDITYTASSGLTIGVYYDGDYQFFVQFSSGEIAYLYFRAIDDMIAAFRDVQTKLNQ